MTEPDNKIKNISEFIDNISPKVIDFVENFEMLYKIHLNLSETLMTKLLDLDSIESLGDNDIRILRKEQIDKIQGLLSQLDQCKLKI